MSYRVQFTISDREYEELKSQAAEESFPDVPQLCKSRALCQVSSREKNYEELYPLVIKKIAEWNSPDLFMLRDLLDTPPALLGRWLRQNVDNGSIPHVEFVDKAPGTGENRYRKTNVKTEGTEDADER